MKIRSVQAHVLRAKLEAPFAYSRAWYDERWSLIVEITSEDGVSGFGEVYGPARMNAPIVRIYGQDVPIRARVEHLQMLSAHADADALVEWMTSEPTTPRRTYVNHGEADASAALQELIWQQLSCQVEVPSFGTTIDTTHLSPELTKAARHG